jgi:hypothetical protein
MLATISPSNTHVEETLNTLRYASKAKRIVNMVRVNEDMKSRKIRKLLAEVKFLKEQLKSMDTKSTSSRLTSDPESRVLFKSPPKVRNSSALQLLESRRSQNRSNLIASINVLFQDLLVTTVDGETMSTNESVSVYADAGDTLSSGDGDGRDQKQVQFRETVETHTLSSNPSTSDQSAW